MGIGTPITIATTGMRHMLDANVTFGMASDRYNARDDYRRSYTDGQRTAAGVGTALGVALPVAGGVAWLQRGLKVPGATGAVTQNVGRAAGLAALGVAAGVGVKKTIDITVDDGHLGAVGTAAGIIGGTAAGLMAGQRFAGKYAPLVSGAGAIIGGVAGHFGGKAIKVGDGNIGVPHMKAPQVDEHVGDRATSFARGAFNHFTEVGPTTQGVSFGYQWGMRDTVQNGYSNAERAGAMHGDLLAAGILGGGALAVAGGLMGKGAGNGVSNLANAANVAGHVLNRGAVTNVLQRLGDKGALGVGAAAAGLAGVVAVKEWDRAMDVSGGDATRAALWAGGSLAATAGTAALVSRSSAMQGMAAAPKAASSALVAAALIGVLSAARLPLQQFYNDAKDATAANGGINWSTAAPAGGLGAVAGGMGAYRGLSKLVPEGGLQLGKFRIPKAALVLGGTALGGAALGGVGVGLSSTMPDLPKVGLSTAGGAVVGAAVAGLTKGVGLKAGIVGGAALGMSASALLRSDEPKSDPAVTDVTVSR